MQVGHFIIAFGSNAMIGRTFYGPTSSTSIRMCRDFQPV